MSGSQSEEDSSGPFEATLNVQKLNLDEVEHELVLCGIDTENLVDKNARLSEVLNQPVQEDKVRELDLVEEVNTLKVKVMELQTLVVEALANKTQLNEDSRAIALYLHCFYRIRRTMFVEPSLFPAYKKMMKALNVSQFKLDLMCDEWLFPKLFDSEDEQADLAEYEERQRKRRELKKSQQEEAERKRELEKRRREREEQTKKIKEESHSSSKFYKKKESKTKNTKKEKFHDKHSYREQKVYQSNTSEDSDQSGSTESEASVPSTRSSVKRSRRRFNPLTRLKISFNGSEDLTAFLNDVEECGDINQMEEEEMLLGVTEILQGNAATWYRRKRQKIASWRAFKVEIKAAFRPDEDEDAVMVKIDALKQSKEETYTVYEAKMEELFDRLLTPLSEKVRIKKLLKGLHLYYRSRVVSKDVDSLRTLRSLCKALEADKNHVMRLERDQRRKDQKRDEKDEKKVKKFTKVSAVEEPREDSQESEEETTSTSCAATSTPTKFSSVICWRCGGSGHLSLTCVSKINCLQCGAPDTVVERCVHCNPAAAQPKWSKKTSLDKPSFNPGNSKEGRIGGKSSPFLGPFNKPPPALPNKGQHPI